jgi:hypothetical protein
MTKHDVDMALDVGQEFAGYTILRVLGSGAMGAVYLAQHPRLPRHDALKVLPADLTADLMYRAWFLQEADVVAGLSHPHIVRIHDRGEHAGQFWISMDYVDGTDAARLLREQFANGMPFDEALAIVAGVGSALDYAHHRGLLHRDVKPANVLLTQPNGQQRRVLLVDFGIARPIDDVSGPTGTNVAVGTVAYAAPEQLRGEPVDGRADQYALACTAFHLLTGVPPFDHPNSMVVVSQHVTALPPAIGARRPELAGLDTVFARAMAKDPSERFGSCGEFVDHLSRHLSITYPDTPASQFAAYAQHDAGANATQPAAGIAVLASPPAALIRKRRPRILISALAGIVLLVGGAVFAGVKLTQQPKPAVPAPTHAAAPAGPPPNTGPFTGTYRVTYGAVTGIEGRPGPLPPTTEIWAVSSACGSAGCAATASRITGETMKATSIVFDQVGDRWLAVSTSSATCNGITDEAWETFVLQPGPNGTFSGEADQAVVKACANKRTVTFTRTSDVDVSTLPSPAALPPRVVSPAEALHGRYHQILTQPNGFRASGDYGVRTDCLRTGDRCLSLFHTPPDTSLPLVYADGKWVYQIDTDERCSNTRTSHMSFFAKFPLPQPSQDPITVLTGSGHEDATAISGAPCPTSTFNLTFTRTGD